LTQWSRHTATEAEVSDVYVRLGYEFNIACRAFTAIGVDTADLGNVPDLLRTILEDTLSQDASSEALDRFLPRIRDIIINLLHGLKRKQQRLRQKEKKEGGSVSSRNDSVGSNGSSAGTGLTEMLESVPRSYSEADRNLGAQADAGRGPGGRDESFPNSRASSAAVGRTSPVRRELHDGAGAARMPSNRDTTSTQQSFASSSSLSSDTMQNLPVLAPYSDNGDTMPLNSDDTASFPPPPPPPKQQDALAALQRGGDLERRASRRYSAYQISKHLGAPGGVPMIPPPQNSPIPNRGRDVRESMNAVRTRGSIHARQPSNTRLGSSQSPVRNPTMGQLAEENTSNSTPTIKLPDDNSASRSERRKLGDKSTSPAARDGQSPIVGATLNGPIGMDAYPFGVAPTSDQVSEPQNNEEKAGLTPSYTSKDSVSEYSVSSAPPRSSSPQEAARQFVAEESPQPGKELTLFLQYKSKIKKFVLQDGGTLSIPGLQLAFIEKFAWNTQSNGNELPEIYIQDPVSGVRHELEDLSDIKDRSVLVLNVEVLDEVKKHIDEGLGGLKKQLEGLRTGLDGLNTSQQRVSERQDEHSKELAKLATMPAPAALITRSRVDGAPLGPGPLSPVAKATQLTEITSLRRDLAVVRQTYSSFVSDMKASMATVKEKANAVKTVAAKVSVGELDADSGRVYVNKGKKQLGDDSDRLVGRVDDLQDTVEDLRKDVVVRGVRPAPRQLENVAKDLSLANQELQKMQGYLKQERPIWTKIWEKELEVVCNDRDMLTMQEELAADLQDDLEGAREIFALVEQTTKEQMKDTNNRSASGRIQLNHVEMDPSRAKEGVLGEVRALQPNHENRLEAIARAEKARQRELATRAGGEFQMELGNFVEEGKLKKSGGVEEAERLRKAKDDRIRKEVWERTQARAAGKGKENAAAAAAPPAETALVETEGIEGTEGYSTPNEHPESEKGIAS
jgi:Actin interacting protein 3